MSMVKKIFGRKFYYASFLLLILIALFVITRQPETPPQTTNTNELIDTKIVICISENTPITTKSLLEIEYIVSNQECTFNKPVYELNLLISRFDSDVDNLTLEQYSSESYEEHDLELKQYFIDNPDALVIIPFTDLDPIAKVIKIDNIHPFLSEESDSYPLLTKYTLGSNNSEDLEEVYQYLEENLSDTLYNPDNLTEVIVTGTSLVGVRTAWFDIRENGDPIYPVRDIAPILQNADLTHISNESVFSDTCVQERETVVFCADPVSFEQLTHIGTDVVNLSSNHILDWGYDDFYKTLEMYDEAGIQYYGAGSNESEARKPAIVEVNGIKFGFLGYNFTPPFTYFATESSGGTSSDDLEKIVEDIKKLEQEVDYVMVDIQWWQEYNPYPDQIQQETARAAIDAGADFINGVQAHAVQGIEYYEDGMIFYGMGNLIYDQRAWEETRRGVIIQHMFYGDEYLGYNLIPTYIPNDLKIQIAGTRDTKIIWDTIFDNSIIYQAR